MKRLTEITGPYAGLCRIRVSLYSALSAGAGYLLIRGAGGELAGTLAAVFLLACGASALNQHTERVTDSLMGRTRARPIPSGRIGPRRALLFSAILLIAGSLLLAVQSNIHALTLGAFTVFWYNGVYTWLKKKTAFAVLPGGLVGAMPPAIGWVAAGGSLLDPRLLLLCFFFFMWQVPHFWLFILEYGKEYERAGLPSLTALFDGDQIVRINFVWISSVAVSCMFISTSGVARSLSVNISLFVMSVWLMWNGIRLFRKEAGKAAFSFAFRGMNTGMLLVMILLACDRFLPF